MDHDYALAGEAATSGRNGGRNGDRNGDRGLDRKDSASTGLVGSGSGGGGGAAGGKRLALVIECARLPLQ